MSTTCRAEPESEPHPEPSFSPPNPPFFHSPSRGFGFVTYEDKADADRVMEIQAQEVAKVIAAHKKKVRGGDE